MTARKNDPSGHPGPKNRGTEMPDSIARGNMADADRDILVELDTALSEHIALLLAWNRRLLVDPNSDTAPDYLPERDFGDAPESQGDHDCNFGAWYALNAHNGLIDQPAMRSLATTHDQLHGSARRLLAHHDATGQVDASEYDQMALRAESFFAQIRRLERAFRIARSDVDPLTGTYNRQTMMTDLDSERERAVRNGTAAAIALVDLDHFKAVNDTHGHQIGDMVLQTVAGILQSHVRPFDKVYRYGGEEFLISLPNADMRQAARILERLRRVIEATPVQPGNGLILPVTASIGASPVAINRSTAETIEKADKALYAAKQAGRNRVRVWRSARDRDQTHQSTP
ncbi:MAG: diguanylate cyclase [Pseudomonadota bacterium]